MIVCSMPGCQTTAGCQCQNRAGVNGWFDQIKKDASIHSPHNACCHRDQCKALEARALAAEAALAAERERVEQLHATIRKAHVAMTMACALPGVAAEYDFSEAIASTEATLARRAAAIRAQGE